MKNLDKKGFLTGRESKLARLCENCIRDQRDVEVWLKNPGDVVTGKVVGYELTAQYFIVTIRVPNENNQLYVLNFRDGVKCMRVPKPPMVTAQTS